MVVDVDVDVDGNGDVVVDVDVNGDFGRRCGGDGEPPPKAGDAISGAVSVFLGTP